MYTTQRQFDINQRILDNMLPEDKPEMFVDFYTKELTEKEIERFYGAEYTIVNNPEMWT